jgi:poly(3-hydroxybutyrate) depolymerase
MAAGTGGSGSSTGTGGTPATTGGTTGTATGGAPASTGGVPGAPEPQDAADVAPAADAPASAADGPQATISAGCGKPAPSEGLHEITVGAAQRKFFLRIPGGYDGQKAWPVIFAFHGAGNKSAAWFDTNTDLRSVSEEKAVLVFGEGARRPDGTLSWVHLSPDNVLFVDAMIDWLKQSACIDPSRLFAVGQSSGGYMAMTLGCQRGDVFRGVATSSGGILEPGTCTGRPAAVWMRTGRADTASTRQSVEVTRDFWVKHKTCAADAPKPTAPEPCVKWSGCQDAAAVVYCEDGGGHDWPGYYSRGLLAQFGL